MIELIVGEKGKGKTKTMVAKAANDSKITGCNIIYIDSNNKLSDELTDQIQLLNIRDYGIISFDMFLGFISGIVCQIKNVDKIFLDNYFTIACIDNNSDDYNKLLEHSINELSKISEKFETDFVIGLSMKSEDLSSNLQDFVTINL